MKKTISWRLNKLPTVEEVQDLLKAKVITASEAKEILFKDKEEDEDKVKSLEQEVKFLKKLAEKLSDNPYTIVEKIKVIRQPYYDNYLWYRPYQQWYDSTMICSSTTAGYDSGSITTTAGNNALNTLTAGTDTTLMAGSTSNTPTSFSSI